jgi:hypothetical protein
MYRRILFFLSILSLLASCAKPYVARNASTTSWLTVTAPPGDPAAQDVIEDIESQREAICQALEVACTFPVQVELFASQADFDAHTMNPDYRGFYAISGQGKIQMVTPSTASAGHDIPYEERVHIAVHEFVHLALDQIDPNLPNWIDEGTAVYLGPHDLYDKALQRGFSAERLPGLPNLVESYDSVPAADLFAYTLVRFIVDRGGLDRLNALLRSAEEREQYIEQGQDAEWQRFLKQAYPPAAPSFTPRSCWFAIPAALNTEISATCGTVAVPENRSLPFSKENTVRLAVMILQAPGVETNQAPIFLLGRPPGCSRALWSVNDSPDATQERRRSRSPGDRGNEGSSLRL